MLLQPSQQIQGLVGLGIKESEIVAPTAQKVGALSDDLTPNF
jgi:hypothetical protein